MQREAPAISVVLPVRNGASTISPALQSICDQSFRDWELIVVDDGSTDETPFLLANFQSREPRLTIIRQAKLGIVTALQKGCELARCGLIARMDADDVMHRHRLQRQFDFLQSNPMIGLVSCLVRHGGSRERQAGYAAYVDWINSLRDPQEISLARFIESPVAHPTVLFRRELLEEFGGYRDGDFPEDYELWLRWLEAGVVFGKVNETLLNWNDSSSRMSRVDSRYRIVLLVQFGSGVRDELRESDFAPLNVQVSHSQDSLISPLQEREGCWMAALWFRRPNYLPGNIPLSWSESAHEERATRSDIGFLSRIGK